MKRKKKRPRLTLLSTLWIVLILLTIVVFAVRINSPVHNKQTYLFETSRFPYLVDVNHSCTSNGTSVEFGNGNDFSIHLISARVDAFDNKTIINPQLTSTNSIRQITPGEDFSVLFVNYTCSSPGDIYSANISISFLDTETNLTITDNGTIIGVSS